MLTTRYVGQTLTAQQRKMYVPDQLRTCEAQLRQCVDQGAAIYVCGSLQGTATGIDKMLRELLGEALVNCLQKRGLYYSEVH